MKSKEKTIARKETKYIGKAQLTYTPSTSFGGSINDAELHYRGKVVKLEPMTLSSLISHAKRSREAIDLELAREALERWNANARELIADQERSKKARASRRSKKG